MIGLWVNLISGGPANQWTARSGESERSSLPAYQIKAGLLYNFAKFIDWPESAFDGPGAPLTIGLLGRDPFDGELERLVSNKLVNGRPLAFRRCTTTADAKKCHLLFISSSEKRQLHSVLTALTNSSVLTVGDTDGFLE